MNSRRLVRIILAAAFLVGRAGVAHINEQGQEPARGVGLEPATRSALTRGRTGAYYALVIGINNYRHLPLLKTAIKDAEEVAAILHDQYGFETRLLRDATKVEITKALNEYARTLGENDNLLIYYAGHGIYDSDNAYWVPVDGEPRDIDNTNWLIAREITTDLKRILARHVLIISDSCYSAGIKETRSISNTYTPRERERTLDKMLAGKSRNLMSSGGVEPVSDAGGSGHSVFASKLIRGLKEFPDDAFTGSDLFFEFILKQVAGNAEQTPEYSLIPNSGLGDNPGDFVFLRSHTSGAASGVKSPARAPSAKPSPPTVQTAKLKEHAENRGTEIPAPSPTQAGANISGCWLLPNNVSVAFHADGTATLAAFTARWRLVDGAAQTYAVTWPFGPVDTATLSPDGLHLQGGNQFGVPLSATRVSSGRAGGGVVGTWKVNNVVDITIDSDGSMRAGSLVARWSLVDAAKRVYTFTWPDFVDTVTLQADGLHFTGSNQYGIPISATKSGACPGN